MKVLVTYDVVTETPEGRRRLRKVAQVCKNYGQRVQKSVFECTVNEMLYERMLRALLKCIDEEEDSLRLYRLLEPLDRNISAYGVNRYVEFNDPLVV